MPETGRSSDAAVVDEVAQELKELAVLMREGGVKQDVYARLYTARTQLGRVVANYGVGVPPKTTRTI